MWKLCLHSEGKFREDGGSVGSVCGSSRLVCNLGETVQDAACNV